MIEFSYLPPTKKRTRDLAVYLTPLILLTALGSLLIATSTMTKSVSTKLEIVRNLGEAYGVDNFRTVESPRNGRAIIEITHPTKGFDTGSTKFFTTSTERS